ncbi:YjbQ family protein [candidate division WOR-3 bacterium]|nr:YjbQ family protein [candidate division WOR-3 bacterium]
MITTLSVNTRARIQLVDITDEIQKLVKEAELGDGMVHVYCPHTTAAVTINENCDASVQKDIGDTLSQLIPHHSNYAHSEGNADAHIKAALMGSSRALFVQEGKVKLGTWQGIFLCEFDGPRDREVWLKFIKNPDTEV